MNLTDLRPNVGASRKRKIVGRGRGSGHGKTSTRGHNGQGQRSGEARRFGFEGGQTPLFRRLPKLHNFDQVINRHWVEVNVGELNELPAGEVSVETLVKHKILKSDTDSLRVLGNGELKVALKITAHHCSAGAKAKIEAAGGSIEVIAVPVVEGKRSKRLAQAYAREELRRNSPKPSEAAKAAKAEEAEKAKAKGADKGGKGPEKAKAPEKKPAAGGGGKGGDKKSGDKKGADKKK